VSGPLYLAWRYLAHHRIKSLILIASVAVIVFLPVGLNVLVRESAAELMSRASATPLVIGAKASPLELVLSALYFESRAPAPIPYAEVSRIAEGGLADPIPLHLRFHARGHAFVGTTLEYLDFRGLELERGRPMAVLGECVLGASAARSLGLEPGDGLVSSSETVFDLAGDYPLKMKVVGVLAASHTPDDAAIFVDVKTAWVIEGHGHGHADLTDPAADSAVLSRDAGRITANASLVEYNEITPENVDSFHFHADIDALPVTAVIAVPHDEKARVLLLGRYARPDEIVQVAHPATVMSELRETVLTIQSYVVAAIALAGAAAVATMGLVFLLSIRLRRREIETLVKLGASRASVASILAGEMVIVFSLGAVLAVALTALTSRFGASAIRALLLT
jgi:putative ABC transport system permease protein